MDWKNLFKVLAPVILPQVQARVNPKTDVGKMFKWAAEHPEMVAVISAAVDSALIHNNTVEKLPTPAEIKNVSDIVLPKTTTPVPVEAKVARTVKSIEAKILGAQSKHKVGEGHPGGGALYDHDELEELRALRDPFVPGDRIHMDNTPEDTQGRKYEPGDPENAQLHLKHFIDPDDGKLELHSADDDNTCTPVYKVPTDYEGEQIYTYHSEQDGVKSNEVKFRCKS